MSPRLPSSPPLPSFPSLPALCVALDSAQVKVNNFVHLRILRLDIGPDFPEYPPHMTLCDGLSKQYWPLDRRAYLYSPRWDAERMATELYAYAKASVPKLT